MTTNRFQDTLEKRKKPKSLKQNSFSFSQLFVTRNILVENIFCTRNVSGVFVIK